VLAEYAGKSERRAEEIQKGVSDGVEEITERAKRK
jgi:hypothetical protein